MCTQCWNGAIQCWWAAASLTPPSCWTVFGRVQCCWHMYQSQGRPPPQWQRASPPAWPPSDACNPTPAPGRSRIVATQGTSFAGSPSRRSPPEGVERVGWINISQWKIYAPNSSNRWFSMPVMCYSDGNQWFFWKDHMNTQQRMLETCLTQPHWRNKPFFLSISLMKLVRTPPHNTAYILIQLPPTVLLHVCVICASGPGVARRTLVHRQFRGNLFLGDWGWRECNYTTNTTKAIPAPAILPVS